jgi:hypothetical protein
VRKIDWTKKLSADDKAWALQRDMHDKVAANEAEFGSGQMPEGAERDKRIDGLRAQITDLDNELQMLLAAKADEEQLGGPAVRGSETVTTGTFTEGEASQTGDPKNRYNTPEWTADKLKAEIESRNEERAKEDLPLLSTAGKKAELVERLMQDDREIEESNTDNN